MKILMSLIRKAISMSITTSIIKSKVIFILLILVITSCDKEIKNFKYLDSEEQLVVNGQFINDTLPIIHISHTIKVNDDESSNSSVSKAKISLKTGDDTYPAFAYPDKPGYYIFSHKPVKGKSYILKVNDEAGKYKEAEAKFTIPDEPELMSIEHIGENNEGQIFKIRIKDPGDIKNAYGLTFWLPIGRVHYDTDGKYVSYDAWKGSSIEVFLSSQDPSVTGVFFGNDLYIDTWSSSVAGVTLFIEDDLFNGKEVVITMVTKDPNEQDFDYAIYSGTPLKVEFWSYDESYVKYAKSKAVYDNSDSDPFAEKVAVFSNVTNGKGVVCGTTLITSFFTVTEK